jgi:hypothetical protein
MVPISELKALLLHPATSAAARNGVWAELVRRARTGSPGSYLIADLVPLAGDPGGLARRLSWYPEQ